MEQNKNFNKIKITKRKFELKKLMKQNKKVTIKSKQKCGKMSDKGKIICEMVREAALYSSYV